ncbi:MAG TPA: hypothetical protein VF079_11680 [Sphingomicrobium sp.]
MRALLLLALALAPPTAAAAQQRVVSLAPDSVAVTVYRDPQRSTDSEMNLDWLGGYALVTETRTVDLPAGTSDIRFEGVADTLIPASVIIRGLPRQPAEKNYDARLLSPGALVDSYLGRQVHIRRTHRKTGKVTESEAIIRSGPNGITLQTPAGIEALSCTGLPETLTYGEVPEGLSDKPTLSIRAAAEQPTRATVRLSYLAGQFDWQANYVASLAADGRTLDLFAWLTLANGNDSSFPAAQTQAVAGEPNREEDEDDSGVSPVAPEISLQCWPSGTTSDVEIPPAAPPPPPPMAERDAQDIVVTGSRIPEANLTSASPVTMLAQQEELGDLKLYRIPEPVTVAANAQKQVALLIRDRVPYERIYAIEIGADNEVEEPTQVAIRLRMKNLKPRGLGLPLPSGTVAVFETVGGRPMLVGEPRMADKAIGEDVELTVGESPDVTYTLNRATPEGERYWESPRRYTLELSNARSSPAIVEVELPININIELVKPSRRLGIKNGRHFWRATVPANGRTDLSYTIRPLPQRNSDGGDVAD